MNTYYKLMEEIYDFATNSDARERTYLWHSILHNFVS